MGDVLPILTVQQPWASAFFRSDSLGPKDVENRSWRTNYRGPLVIHAGSRVDRHAFPELGFDSRDVGVILGTVELTGCHNAGSPGCLAHKCSSNPWAFWRTPWWADPDSIAQQQPTIVHWTVEHPRRFVTPIHATGRQQLWRADPSLEHLIATAEVAV